VYRKRRYEQDRCHWHADQWNEDASQHSQSADDLNNDRRPTHKRGQRNADGMQYADKVLGPVHDLGVAMLHEAITYDQA
jgi:hypothetical protein